ncbi:patr class I histocompatibility antigen, A-126 alpha chain [Phodopus roborovskii]|uniref:patr class I histocompatibility antigen, A-126 alpha chain n=1 Tax=Phodopus roborovskii TaxID=109678 RepID=UPI0021E3870C|nr:patr class I histocompatibility antigen, A-126 alpha chain [Phodopus roborovskii]
MGAAVLPATLLLLSVLQAQTLMEIQNGADDMQILCFKDSEAPTKVEPRVAWAKQMGRYYWKLERESLQYYAQKAQENLQFAIQIYNQSDDGSHTFQSLIGCEVGPDQRFLRGHNRHAFDGSDYISLNEDMRTWTVADTTAQITQRQWDAENVSEDIGIFFGGRCVPWLLWHLELGKEILQRSESPLWPTIGMTIGVVLLGVVVTGAVAAIVMVRKKSSGRKGIGV